ncbi:MAG: hypothetical protein K9K66_01355 [Desulfarculaceae bacterium]|nr:hypothetical protein [Desulfarculaceae bacterium]MCF8072360.1 hypothetical protein [Desulfarculaceae bacterium]MCF8100281.1 hypothetical protein [Desulfarculaceae bacterium]MCF8116146.1 hypothetical protein [Desulfarculaceae bacterium]
MSAYRKLVSSEAIALLAALCIAAIFVGSYYQRRMDNQDEQALKVAQQIYQLLSKAPAAQPAPEPATTGAAQTSPVTPDAGPAQISLLKLKAMGLGDPSPIQVIVQDPSPTAWKVAVEHPLGIKRYVVTPQGVKEEVR